MRMIIGIHRNLMTFPIPARSKKNPNKGLTVDPNATLAEILDLVNRTLDGEDEACAMDLAEAVEILDKWINGGGFLPGDWEEV